MAATGESEEVPPTTLPATAQRLLAAVRAGRERPARRWLDALAAPGESAHLAAAVGDAEALRTRLAAAPGAAAATALATARDANDWSPLRYAAGSPLHRADPRRAAGLLRCAELLLAHGAEASETSRWEDPDGEARLPVLYHPCVVDHVAMVRLLLAHGADPDDGESVYHAAERNHRGCLEALLAHGADLSSRHPRWQNTPLYFLTGWKEPHPMAARAIAGQRWLLEHGADPDVTSYATQETPLHRAAAYGRPPRLARLLLDHGATVDAARADGATPLALAVRAGHTAMATLLLERGADLARVRPLDDFLGACARADGDAARALLARHPGLLASFGDEERAALAAAAHEGRDEAVRLMVELGFDLRWEHAWGGTPLHHAAWRGRPATARTLLELGAPLDPRDRTYGSSPLAWAAHGSRHGGRRGAADDYRTVVELLLDAGATREAAINRWGEPPESMASAAVAALLRRRGFAPARRRQVALRRA